jgi:5-(carboxyamino)imidazole ribonucleotide mutase
MAQVEIVAGSESDLEAIKNSKMTDWLAAFDVSWRLSVISAHRNPAALAHFCQKEIGDDCCAVIAAAGMAAALPGNIVAWLGLYPPLPVFGVALSSSNRPDALDATESMIRTPAGVPLAFAGIDKAGLINAAILAGQVVGLTNNRVKDRVKAQIKKARDAKPAKIGIDKSAD